MAEAEYPGNSNRAKEASLVREQVNAERSETPEKAEHPIRRDAPTEKRKLSPVKEVFHAIFPGGFAEVKDKLIWELFVPWAQDMLHNGWQSLGDVIFPGSNRKQPNQAQERYSYNTAYRLAPPSYQSGTYDGSYYNEMRPRSREEAEEALRDLQAMWMRYKLVTLLDFNERVGNPTRPTQNNYGWLSLDSATIKYVNGPRPGWVIDMPRAVPIDNYR